MDDPELLAQRFEADREHLRGVAYRMLGSLSEAEDAVQEAWLRLSRAGATGIDNLRGWLTTVTARVCLDLLRARKARREDPVGMQVPEPRTAAQPLASDEAQLADSVGLALLVVLETLAPAERLAFVLHDLFAVSFDEIASIVGRTPTATRQLASRARRRVQGVDLAEDPVAATRAIDRARHRKVVDAFLAAARAGDFDGLLAVLDPDAVIRTDVGVKPPAPPKILGGATDIAKGAIRGGAQAARAALINGAVGIVIAPKGRLTMVLVPTIVDDRIVEMNVISGAARLAQLELSTLLE